MRHILSKLFPEYRSVRPTPQSIEDDARLLINTEATQQRVAIENLEQEIAYLQECLAKRKTALIALEAANKVFQPVSAPSAFPEIKTFDKWEDAPSPSPFTMINGELHPNAASPLQSPLIVGKKYVNNGELCIWDGEDFAPITTDPADYDQLTRELEKALTDDDFSIEKTTPETNNGTGGNLKGNGSGGGKEPEPDKVG